MEEQNSFASELMQASIAARQKYTSSIYEGLKTVLIKAANDAFCEVKILLCEKKHFNAPHHDTVFISCVRKLDIARLVTLMMQDDLNVSYSIYKDGDDVIEYLVLTVVIVKTLKK